MIVNLIGVELKAQLAVKSTEGHTIYYGYDLRKCR